MPMESRFSRMNGELAPYGKAVGMSANAVARGEGPRSAARLAPAG